jgi:ABC-type amino acid transport substrate-binding protein
MNTRLALTAAALAALTATGLVAGCSGPAPSDSPAADSPVAAPTGSAEPAPDYPTSVNIAGAGLPDPYQFEGADGKLDGYDIAVAEEVAKRAGITLTWEKVEFPGLFLGLDSGKYQVVVNNLSKTAERQEKYLFGDEYYSRNRIVFVTPKGDTSVTKIDDLAGKKVAISSGGDTYAIYLQNYNKEHPDAQIELLPDDTTPSDHVRQIADGTRDAWVGDQVIVDSVVNETGIEVQVTPLAEEDEQAIAPTKSYPVFAQGQEALLKVWDDKLKELVADGTLAQLSVKYFGADYSR